MRKICVFIGSRANYSSIKSAMLAIKDHPDLELQLVVGASAMLDRYGSAFEIIERDGFTIDEKVSMILEGETPLTMAKSTAIGLMELPTVFDRLQPDVVITVGDRFETMATAVASAYMNIPLAHTMGGEITGTIDESVRHAVTKLAHIHFPANTEAAERIVKMGEERERVHTVGCPRIDVVANILKEHAEVENPQILDKEGVGGHIDTTQPYLVVMQYPVTTEYGQGEDQINETLAVLQELQMPTVMLWPNADAGAEDVARGIRKFREHHDHEYIRFYKNIPLETFIPLLKQCSCLIGNSSAAIREGSFIGVPAVNIGTRQRGRDRGANILDVGYDRKEILAAIKQQLDHGPYESDTMYGDGHAGKKIADVLATCPLNVDKLLVFS